MSAGVCPRPRPQASFSCGHCLDGLCSQSSSPQQPQGAMGPSGVPPGSSPWTLAAQVHCSHHEAQAEAPGSFWSRRGLRSVELSQHGHCQDSRRGVGAAGITVLILFLPQLLRLTEPLPFLGKVELSLSAGFSPARKRGRKTIESHPSPSQRSHHGSGGWGWGEPCVPSPTGRSGWEGPVATPQEGILGVRYQALLPLTFCPGDTALPRGASAPWVATSGLA